MNTTYLFEQTDRHSDQYPVPALRVHASVVCGHYFKDVAAILEPDSANPCLLLNKPVGLSGVKQIIARLEKMTGRSKGGETVSTAG